MIIALGETLGMCTIAEGIEDAQQATALREVRCELAQGYYYSAPVPPEEFVRRAIAGMLSPDPAATFGAVRGTAAPSLEVAA